MQVSIQFTREESPHFPCFGLPVLTPVEAIYASLRSDEGGAETNLPILAALIAFLAHSYSDKNGKDSNSSVEKVLCHLLHSVNPSDLSDWRLGPFLSGKQHA